MAISKYFKILAFSFALSLTGCASINDINQGFYRVGMSWQVDNQKAEDEFRYRVIDASYFETYEAVRKAFLTLGMPVRVSDVEKGVLFAENVAPYPLTKEEWLEVKKIETPRLKALAGSMFYFQDNPKDFTITVRATLKPLSSGVLVIVDYVMDSPKLRSYGITPTSVCPPTAVALGSAKFWKAVEEEVLKANLSAPRKRKVEERVI